MVLYKAIKGVVIMSNIEGLINQWSSTHSELETLLYSVSENLRKACFGGYIRGFYDKSTSDIVEIIKTKTGVEILSIKGIILKGDENLLKYHLKIDERLLNYFKQNGMLENPTRFQSDEYRRDAYYTSLGFGADARDEFKKEFKYIPLTYLTNHLKSVRDVNKSNQMVNVSTLENSIYNSDDSTRNKLKKVNKKITEILFNMKYNQFSIFNILRQRYVFYGVDCTQEEIIKARTVGTGKNPDQLFDIMDELELAHHLNISVKILAYLMSIKNKIVSEKEIEEKVRTIAINEAIIVCNIEGIKPIDYKNKLEKLGNQKKIKFDILDEIAVEEKKPAISSDPYLQDLIDKGDYDTIANLYGLEDLAIKIRNKATVLDGMGNNDKQKRK
jgi:hypothetical protein